MITINRASYQNSILFDLTGGEIADGWEYGVHLSRGLLNEGEITIGVNSLNVPSGNYEAQFRNGNNTYILIRQGYSEVKT